MALIFQRLARNFIKNGYFPTDAVTLARIIAALDVPGGQVRIIDPCCGEGAALADIKHHFQENGSTVDAYGIEFDAERAWHAKQLINTVAHSDVNDVVMASRSMGLLFLNPPYGETVSDKAGTGDQSKNERLEKLFLTRTLSWLKPGGVLVLIVPYYVLGRGFAPIIARHFTRVRIFKAPEQQFKQCVIFGVRRRPDVASMEVLSQFAEGAEGKLPELPENWTEEPYTVPMADEEDVGFCALRIDAPQLVDELKRCAGNTLWPQFGNHFAGVRRALRRPLRGLSRWHLALALAAGQVCGLVASKSGRKLLIKGDTFKEKETHVDVTINEESGAVCETRTMTDKFVPVIRGIDFTEGPQYGSIVTVR